MEIQLTETDRWATYPKCCGKGYIKVSPYGCDEIEGTAYGGFEKPCEICETEGKIPWEREYFVR
jgi:hypothetical protein